MTKKYLLLASIFVLIIVSSCNRYNKITFSSNKLYKQKEVVKNIEEYDVYVHDEDRTYRLEDPEMNEDNLSGTASEISSEERNAQVGDTLNDIHLYVSNTDAFEPNSTQSLSPEDIESVEMYGKQNEGDGMTVAAIVLLVILLVLVIGLVILLVLINSVLDGSGSGGSDSGDLISGCYVATMAYGSYDAPQVVVLREFRDRFLQKSRGGRAFIKWYYAKSPGFVEQHRSKLWLHKTLRVGLNVFVTILRPFYAK